MKSSKILIFIVFTLAILAALCALFPPDGVEIAGKRLFFPTLEEILVREKSSSAAEKLEKLESDLRIRFVADSLAVEKDS
ncbi:MAG: hypothetical protein LBV75_02970, partial [Paludibacter sp.]|nr:hypothetical protein [Paludibacter sp.]